MQQWEGRRVYGADQDDAPGPQPGHDYVELIGGPLDGRLVDVTGWEPAARADGAALIADAPAGMHGPGGRALYGPQPDAGADRWYWEGDTA
jgi:hypothetical protein